MKQESTVSKTPSIYNYDERLTRTYKIIKKELSQENQDLIEKYDKSMIAESLAKATRHKHLQTILNLTRFLGKDWKDATTDEINNVVVRIVQEYAGESGQETNTSYDHKKILKIFFRWYKLGSRNQKDVGCSFGIAMKKAAENMKVLEFEPYTIGIDASKNVKSKAEKNLDRFINKDVLDVNDQENIGDIVICSKAAIFVLGPRRADIIRKCASFLKNNGLLITDVDCYPPRTLRENTRRMLRFFWFQIPSYDCFKKGIKNIPREYARRANTTIKEDVFTKTEQEAMSYVDEIIKGWEKRSSRWKLWWRFRILILLLTYSLASIRFPWITT